MKNEQVILAEIFLGDGEYRGNGSASSAYSAGPRPSTMVDSCQPEPKPEGNPEPAGKSNHVIDAARYSFAADVWKRTNGTAPPHPLQFCTCGTSSAPSVLDYVKSRDIPMIPTYPGEAIINKNLKLLDAIMDGNEVWDSDGTPVALCFQPVSGGEWFTTVKGSLKFPLAVGGKRPEVKEPQVLTLQEAMLLMIRCPEIHVFSEGGREYKIDGGHRLEGLFDDGKWRLSSGPGEAFYLSPPKVKSTTLGPAPVEPSHETSPTAISEPKKERRLVPRIEAFRELMVSGAKQRAWSYDGKEYRWNPIFVRVEKFDMASDVWRDTSNVPDFLYLDPPEAT